MILLRSDCLLIQTRGPEVLPWSLDAITIEFAAEEETFLDPDLIHHAAAAVFHYYRRELKRTAISLAEFSESFERVLRGFGLRVRTVKVGSKSSPSPHLADSNHEPVATPASAPSEGGEGWGQVGLLGSSMPEERAPTVASDLRRLACDSGRGFELIFFPRLRQEIRRNLSESPKLVRFQGLRGCVKQLTGARRWTHRCQRLNDQIVDYLRLCWSSEVAAAGCALVVE